jgi:hypothetical protein
MSKKAPGEYQQLDHSGSKDPPAVYPDPPPLYTSQTVPLEIDDAPPKHESSKKHRVFVSDHDPLPPEPSHYLVWSVLATIFCCGTCGFIAVVMGLLVGQRYNRRDYPSARRFSGRAKTCTILSFIFGIACIITMIAFWVWWYKVIYVGVRTETAHLEEVLNDIVQAIQQQQPTPIS